MNNLLIFFSFSQKQLKFKSFLSEVAKLSVLKRLLLKFQFSGGEVVYLIVSDYLRIELEKELRDDRFKIKIFLINPSKICDIKSQNNFLYISFPCLFDMEFMNYLVTFKQYYYVLEIKPRFIDLQGAAESIITNCYLLPSNWVNELGIHLFNQGGFNKWIQQRVKKKIYDKEVFYLEINNQASIKFAEKALIRLLRKPSDFFISKYLNRPISLWITRFVLMKLSFSPNKTTFLTIFISLLSFYFIVNEGYWNGFVGGLLFHLASIMDGCDGEIARLRFQFSKYGDFFDSVVDDSKNLLFTIGIGIRSYFHFKLIYLEISQCFYYGIWISSVLFVIGKFIQYKKLLKNTVSKDVLNYKYYFEEKPRKKLSILSKIIVFFSYFARSDVMAFTTVIVSILSLYFIFFWLYAAFFVGIFFMILYQEFLNSKKIKKH